MEQESKTDMFFFRAKVSFLCEQESGELKREKIEALVMASCYADAEKTAYEIPSTNAQGVYVEITKTKIRNVHLNDVLEHDKSLTNGLVCTFFEEDEESGVGLYAVKILEQTMDENSGRRKSTAYTEYMPAKSNADAIKRVTKLYENCGEVVTRDTKFDHASRIYWTKYAYQALTTNTKDVE